MANTLVSTLQPYALSVLRIIVGFTFSLHGVQKVLGWLGGRQVTNFGLLWIAGYLELIGGLLIIVCLFTSQVAFILSGMMAVAYFMQHVPQGFFPIVNRGELAVVYCLVFFYLSSRKLDTAVKLPDRGNGSTTTFPL